MKTSMGLVVILIFFGCSSKKNSSSTTNGATYYSILSACPEEGTCAVELLRNKSLNVKADEFGSIYYQLLDSEGTNVIRYTYDKTVPEGLQDGNHREEIIFEISTTNQTLTLTGKELQQTKMLFGRFCFCRGQTGSYKVEDGTLNLTQKDDSVHFDLQFANGKVPQLLATIKVNLK